MIRILAMAALAAGLAACSSMDNGAPAASRSVTAASETPPGTVSVAPAVTGQNSSTVSPQSPAPPDRPR